MRKIIILPAILMFFAATAQEKKLNGAYAITKAFYGNEKEQHDIGKTTIVKIFEDGYWIGAFFNKTEKTFDGSCGGTYTVKDGKYIETINFYSWDSTAVGTTYTFNYQLNGNAYLQEGKINTRKYKDYLIKEEYNKIVPAEKLESNKLEGAWQMQTGQWGNDKLGEGVYKNVSVTKIYAYPRFAFSYYDIDGKKFVGAGGGTYEFDGTKLTENIEYWSWGKPEYPVSVFKVAFAADTFTQQGWDSGLSETWKHAK
jgi:hypothetical protein